MRRQPIDTYDGPMTLGIDVSSWQGEIDWPRVARSVVTLDGEEQGEVRFAIVRLADGVQSRHDSKPDPRAARNLAGASDAGLLVGGYVYLRAYHPVEEQIEIALEAVRVSGARVGPIAIDVEGRPDDPSTPDTDEASGAWWTPDGAEGPVATAAVLADVATATRILRAAGHLPMVYAGQAWHWYVSERGIGGSVAVGDLWLPSYAHGAPRLPVTPAGGPAPWRSWRVWQFSARARVPGIDVDVDVDWYRGDGAELSEWWGAEPERIFDRAEIEVLAHRAEILGDLDAARELRATLGRL